ncbi:MAG: TOBE domain-containing protein, partial [Chloroflexota bacterium]
DSPNSARGRIQAHVYMGRYTRFKVALGDHLIEAVTDPGQVRHFEDGDEVHVQFEPDKIWVLPPRDA